MIKFIGEVLRRRNGCLVDKTIVTLKDKEIFNWVPSTEVFICNIAHQGHCHEAYIEVATKKKYNYTTLRFI